MNKYQDSYFWTKLGPLYSHLISLGNIYPLDFRIDADSVAHELQIFSNDWKIYNPFKPNYKRYGLSVTSLDGGLSGELDLTSLRESNMNRGTNFNELSFRKLTPVYDACKSIQPLVDCFKPAIGRSHFLKFETGGFFPYHRDSYTPDGDTFRIFVPLNQGSSRDFVFLLGNQRVNMEAGRPYFVNTRVEHAVFSMDAAPSIHLVMNIELTANSVESVCNSVLSK